MTARKQPAKKAPAKRPSRAKPKPTVPNAIETPTTAVTGIGPLPHPGPPRKGAEQAHIDARRARVEVLELAGASVRKIAETVHVDVHTAFDDIKAVRLARRNHFAGVDLQAERDLELARLEQQRLDIVQIIDKVKPSGTKSGDVPSALRAHRELLGVASRKSKLIGLDAPQQVVLSGEVRGQLALGVSSAELAELLVDGTGVEDVDQ